MGAHEIQKDQGKLKKEKMKIILKKIKTKMKTIISRTGQEEMGTGAEMEQVFIRIEKPSVMFVVIKATWHRSAS